MPSDSQHISCYSPNAFPMYGQDQRHVILESPGIAGTDKNRTPISGYSSRYGYPLGMPMDQE